MTARGGQSYLQDAQANSCYLLLLIRVMTNYCACVGMVTEGSAFTLFIRAVLECSEMATFIVPF